MNSETFNAKIISTHLGPEDHGIFSFMLMLEGDGCGQGFGGYALDDRPLRTGGGRRGAEFSIALLSRILSVVGVSKWEDLKGKYVRAVREDGLLRRIGHITEDKWCDPKRFFDEYEAERPTP